MSYSLTVFIIIWLLVAIPLFLLRKQYLKKNFNFREEGTSPTKGLFQTAYIRVAILVSGFVSLFLTYVVTRILFQY